MDEGKVEELHAEGLSNREISKKLGEPPWRVDRYILSRGLTPNGRRRGVRYERGEESKCSVCAEWKPTANYQLIRPNSATPYRLTYCNECRNIQKQNTMNSDPRRYLKDKFQRTRVRARKKGLVFTSTWDEWWEQWEAQDGKCFYTDVVMECRIGAGVTPNAASVDKVEPALGYAAGNVVFCSKRANSIKFDMTLSEMREWTPGWFERVQVWRSIGIPCHQVNAGDF